MNFTGVLEYLSAQFEKHNIRCAVIGGFAMHAAGLSRATNDIDFLVHQLDAPKVKVILTAFGYEIAHESQDVINFWGKLKGLGGVDFIIAHRQYALGMLKKAKPCEIILGCTLPVAIPEDLIGLKLQAAANDPSRALLDMSDIEWLIKHHHQRLNENLLKEYFGLFNRTADLERIFREIKSA